MVKEKIEGVKFEVWDWWRIRKEKLLFWAVWHLPRRMVEISAVRVWANATTGPFGNENATDTKFDVALKRWMREEGGDKSFHPPEVSC